MTPTSTGNYPFITLKIFSSDSQVPRESSQILYLNVSNPK
jgi:hypothetical protein